MNAVLFDLVELYVFVSRNKSTNGIHRINNTNTNNTNNLNLNGMCIFFTSFVHMHERYYRLIHSWLQELITKKFMNYGRIEYYHEQENIHSYIGNNLYGIVRRKASWRYGFFISQ